MPARYIKSLAPSGGDTGFSHREHRSKKGRRPGTKERQLYDMGPRGSLKKNRWRDPTNLPPPRTIKI